MISCLVRTLVIGPADPEVIDVDRDAVDVLGLKADILWLTPSASMNCSRSSIFVRPFAIASNTRAERAISKVENINGTGMIFLQGVQGRRKEREKKRKNN